ncbi:MAG: anthranilate synthase component I [candidate division Zixibacteria bacterium]|nr:anthranilate synthase component I [candidate division Zixibacteria bacterium]
MSEFSAFRRHLSEDGLFVFSAELPAELLTPAEVLLRLGGDTAQSSFLFESVETGGSLGRYSFIGVNPAEEVRTREEHGEHRFGHLTREFHASELRQVLTDAMVTPKRGSSADDVVGFAGGWVGFFGYDWVRDLETLPSEAEPLPRYPWTWLGLYDEVVVFDHVYQTAHINISVRGGDVKDMVTHRRLYERSQRRLERTMRRLRRPHPMVPLSRLQQRPIKLTMKKKDFLEGVRTIKTHIKEGDIFQCVLSQRFTVEGKQKPFDTYRRLRRLNPSPYMYFLKFGNLAVVGSSPETLVQKRGKHVLTRPIAGTRPRGKDDAEDAKLAKQLLASPKENAEHIMLVDLGRNDLGRVCKPGTVEPTQFRDIEKYSHVMHMVSTVTGEVKRNVDAVDVLAAAFPAGTVSGAPKIRAMEIIDALEPHRRGVYGGCVGYLDWWGNLDTAIAIRTAVMDTQRAHVQAGAGIVADSNPEREYKETQNKAAAPLAALGGEWKRGDRP